MKKLNPQVLRTVTRVMAESFREYPVNLALLQGVARREELFFAHCALRAKHAMERGNLKIMDGNPGAFLIGQDSCNERRLPERVFVLRTYLKTLTVAGYRDFNTVISNIKKMREVIELDWHHSFVQSRYYRVKLIAIDREIRGTGAFRRLMTPTIRYCDEECIPMVLETHNHEHVGLYAHFLFRLVKTITSKNTEVRQYCMIRNPETT